MLLLLYFFFPQSFFGFGQSAEIDIVLEGQDSRKTAEIKTEDGKKERYYLYYDGETVGGKVRKQNKPHCFVVISHVCVNFVFIDLCFFPSLIKQHLK